LTALRQLSNLPPWEVLKTPIMSFSGTSENDAAAGAGQFNTTHWSVVLLAGQSQTPHSAAALETLCCTYWSPLYAYVRRQGYGAHDAQDLTQEFFARLLEKKYLQLADRERGRFRSFLLKSLHHFLVNEWVRGQAQKRGSGHKAFSLDEEAAERSYLQQAAMDQLAPESLYDKRWAMILLERAMDQLAATYTAAGKTVLFNHLRTVLLTEGSGESYRQMAGPLGLSEGAVKVAVHRLRQRFREAVRSEIARTVASPAEVDEELRCLMMALSV
jgi:RNA polymerase sigma factor (sigma-70 family)